jgi:hypothetical protein
MLPGMRQTETVIVSSAALASAEHEDPLPSPVARDAPEPL